MVSFIIPVFNEEKNIGRVIDAARRVMAGLDHEFIVVDNGSKDASAKVAADHGATVLPRPGIRIGAMRNEGVAIARGDILVFIDSDIFLKPKWREAIAGTIERLRQDDGIITGCHPGIDDEAPSWLERYWFKPFLARDESNYLSSAHLIMAKSLFRRAGGFDAKLETNEDYDLCQRAIALGARIAVNPSLEVSTNGYPKKLKNFFRRERWHGRADFASLSNLFKSKPAMVAMYHPAGVAVFGAADLIMGTFIWTPGFLCVLLIIWTMLSLRRCGRPGLAFLVCIPVYAVYFIARVCACYDMIFKRPARVRNAVVGKQYGG